MDDEYISDMQFNASKEVYDKDNNKLFGFIIRQQGSKLIMITEIYDESRRKEIIDKTKTMAFLAEKIVKDHDIDRVCVVDAREVTEQLGRHKIDPEKFYPEKIQDVIIEVEDWVRGGFVSVDFTMKLVKE